MWKTSGCAVLGRGHARAGLPCQDRIAFAEGGGITAMALADGAGSAPEAAAGAELVARTAADFLLAHFHALLAAPAARARARVLATLRTALREQAAVLDCALGDLAATALAVAADDTHFFLLHLGDGVIGARRGGTMHVASAPDNGEFANVTTFVTSPDAAAHLFIARGRLAGIDGFVLLSDGTGHSFFQKQHGRLMPRLAHVLASAAAEDRVTFLAELTEAMTTVVAARTQDDCSIALMVRAVEEEETAAMRCAGGTL